MVSRLDKGPQVAIIGAGVAGLAAAEELTRQGFHSAIFDKGRGPGGRISSRRSEPFHFDHGAQYFTARDGEFRKRVMKAVDEGAVAAWQGEIVSFENGELKPLANATERFVGTPRMSSLAQHLAQGHKVESRTRITELWRKGEQWLMIDDQSRQLGPFDAVLLTIPSVQARELVREFVDLATSLEEVLMDPCWAVLLGFEDKVEVPFDGAFCNNSKLSWIARNNSKPQRPTDESWILHASRAWTESHLEASRELVFQELLQEFRAIAGKHLPTIVHHDVHLWRYSQPRDESRHENLSDSELGLFFAGDAFRGGRVEGAWLSGTRAARDIVSQLG